MAGKKNSKMDMKLDARVVPIGTVHENDWNPNRQTDRTFEAEKESITEFGFVDPVTVRVHPDHEGEWQVVDGAHRLRAMRELGMTDIAVNVIDVSLSQAKRLTIILNETRGTPDRIDLATLLVELRDEVGLDELKIGLPYAEDELDGLFKLPDFDFNQFAKGTEGSDDDDDTKWVTIAVRVPDSLLPTWERARERIEAEGEVTPHAKDGVRNGLALEGIIADWLAS